MPTKNYRKASPAFWRLWGMVDKVVVLDDNSTTPFPFQNMCDIYLSMKRRGPWNCSGNRLLLLQMAYQLGCDWVLRLDDDMILGHELQTRKQLDSLVAAMVALGKDEAQFECRELWDTKDHYRVDGLWGNKVSALLQRNWLFDKGITMPDLTVRLHAPGRLSQPYLAPAPVYHLGSLTAAQRQARVDKYKVEDLNNEFQRDYSYLVDRTGAEFRKTPQADLALL